MTAKQTPNLAVDDVPEPGECSPLCYAAMTPSQRAEYDKRLEAFLAERNAAIDAARMYELAKRRMYEGVMPC